MGRGVGGPHPLRGLCAEIMIIIVERSGKLSKMKFMTAMTLLVSSRNEGNLKLFWFQVHSELQRKTTQNPKFALSILPRIQNVKENGL